MCFTTDCHSLNSYIILTFTKKKLRYHVGELGFFLSLRGGMAVEYGNEFALVRCPCSLLLSRMLV